MPKFKTGTLVYYNNRDHHKVYGIVTNSMPEGMTSYLNAFDMQVWAKWSKSPNTKGHYSENSWWMPNVKVFSDEPVIPKRKLPKWF